MLSSCIIITTNVLEIDGPPLIGKDMAQLLFDEIGRALMSEFGPTLEPVLLRAKDRLPSMVEACTARLNAPIDWRSADDMIPGPGIPNPSPSSTGLLPQVTAISNSSTSLQASSVVSTSNQPSIFETHTDVSSNDSSIDRLDSTEMCPRNAGPVTLALRSEEMMTLDDIVQLLNSECGPSRTKTSHSHVTSGPAAHCANSIAGYGGGIDEFTSCGFLDTKQEIPSSLTDEAFDYTQWLEEEELD
jgi:hypothetical protein